MRIVSLSFESLPSSLFTGGSAALPEHAINYLDSG
jgi:hypothetical protein